MKFTAPHQRDDTSVTIIVSRVVKPGSEAAFEEWLEGVGREAARFTGYLGANVQRPTDPKRPEYVLIFRFDSYENLRKWNESAVRAEWLERARAMTLEEPHLQMVTGLEHWFTLPGRPAFAPPPPRFKMALLTWMAIFPLATGLSALLGPAMSGMPPSIQGLVTSGLMVLLMTYLVMPRITRWFAHWLFGGPPAAS